MAHAAWHASGYIAHAHGSDTDWARAAHVQFQNGSDHVVVASYSGLYEECDVEYINVFGLVS